MEKWLYMAQRLAFFYIGLSLGVHLGRRPHPLGLKEWFLACIVYTLLVALFLIAKVYLLGENS